ncbi:MAG: CvpA family protein [Candidatus Daviesbacteria bacterium]|nr:CvpA family protein [Candidatus Daviesbacteria bacterium]
MNWVDLAIIILLLFFVYESIGRNLIGEILDSASFVIAFIASLRFYNDFALFFINNFQVPNSLAKIFGFLSVWFLVEIVFFGLIHFVLFRLIKAAYLPKVFNSFSFIPALLRGLVFVSIILVLLGTFPIQPKIKKDIHDSRLGSAILNQTYELEGPLKGVFGGITEDTFTFLTIKPKSDETVNLGFKTNEFSPNQAYENQLISLVNKEREARNLQSLTVEPTLTKIARSHSADMFKRGYFAHNSPEGKNVSNRALENNYIFLVIGENLAYAPSVGLAHKGLMDSEGHRKNILSPDFNKIGIGIMDGGIYGLMITQVFSN